MIIVLKYGGNAMAAPGTADPLLDEVASRAAAGDRVAIVHGGGPQIDAELARAGHATERIEGQRVTDALTLAITERVLCGEVNKALVRALLRRGARAVGISGEDAGFVRAGLLLTSSGASLGHVGAVETVDAGIVRALFDGGFLPVIAPLALGHDGEALNVNADATAAAVAGALDADAFVVITDVSRVRRVASDPSTGIERIDAAEARSLLAAGVFEGGMRPKIESALAALERGARRVAIAGAGPDAIARALAGEGTTLVA